MFVVINLRTEEKWLGENDEPMIFETGEDAKLAADNLTYFQARHRYYTYGAHARIDDYRHSGLPNDGTIHRSDKWQVRRMATKTENWKEREAERFADGYYTPVHWADDPTWIELKGTHYTDHFVHISKTNPCLVSYIPDEESGQNDRQIRTTPSRYLKKFYAQAVSEDTIEKWLALWTKATDKSVTLKIANTRKEIRRVYNEGPDSCMKGEPARWFSDNDSFPHPTEVYAAGDLAIAYIERKSEDEDIGVEITARCVVWPDRKIISRVYGDDSYLLRSFLMAEGYQDGNVIGARLLKIPYRRPNTFVMPYVDGGVCVDHSDDDYLMIAEKGWVCESTTGYMTIAPPFVSEKSGKSFGRWQYTPVTVHTEHGPVTWASCELDHTVFRSEYSGDYFLKSLAKACDVIVGSSMRTYASTEISESNLASCHFYNMTCIASELNNVLTGFYADGKAIIEKWSGLAVSRHAFAYDGMFYAVWLKSHFAMNQDIPFFREHQHRYILTGEINMYSAPRMMRRQVRIEGETRTVYPEEVQIKIDQGIGIKLPLSLYIEDEGRAPKRKRARAERFDFSEIVSSNETATEMRANPVDFSQIRPVEVPMQASEIFAIPAGTVRTMSVPPSIQEEAQAIIETSNERFLRALDDVDSTVNSVTENLIPTRWTVTANENIFEPVHGIDEPDVS